MLTSGMDMKTDPQLSDEFEHLLNAINSLEMAALKQGTGFSAPIGGCAARCSGRGHLPGQPGVDGEGRGGVEDDQSPTFRW